MVIWEECTGLLGVEFLDVDIPRFDKDEVEESSAVVLGGCDEFVADIGDKWGELGNEVGGVLEGELVCNEWEEENWVFDNIDNVRGAHCSTKSDKEEVNF